MFWSRLCLLLVEESGRLPALASGPEQVSNLLKETVNTPLSLLPRAPWVRCGLASPGTLGSLVFVPLGKSSARLPCWSHSLCHWKPPHLPPPPHTQMPPSSKPLSVHLDGQPGGPARMTWLTIPQPSRQCDCVWRLRFRRLKPHSL